MKKLVVACAITFALLVSGVHGAEINKKKLKVRVTYYTQKECPNKYTKWGTIPTEGRTCALSRDLVRKYKPEPFQPIFIPNVGIRFYEDTTAEKVEREDGTTYFITNRVDVFHKSGKGFDGEVWVSIGEMW